MRRSKLIVGLATVVATALASTASWVSTAHAAGGPNLSLGKTVTSSSSNGPYVAGNLTDGNQGSYWESTNNAFPQWAQVDLGATVSIDQVILALPANWGSRTQTLSVQGSQNGSSFTTIVASAGRLFDPGSNNRVTVDFAATSTRYVRISITANTGWPAAQLSELEVYGAGTATGNLAAGRPTAESGHGDVYGSGNVVDGNQG